MINLAGKFEQLLGDENGSVHYRTEKLKKGLSRHYGDSISFHAPINRSQSMFVISSTINLHDALQTVYDLNEELQEDFTEEDDQTYHEDFGESTGRSDDETLALFHAGKILG